jgi:acyl-CoA synthetase (AMP-forming)/AMP-acid ligase II
MPLSHSFGLVAGLFAASELDATLYAFTSTPDPSTLLTVLEREKIELLYLTPPLLRMLLKRARGRALGALPHLSIVSVGSAALSRAELRGMLRCFPGAQCFYTYGLTELGPRVSTFAAGSDAAPHPALELEPTRPAPLGEPLDGVTLELRDRALDGVGELFVTSPYAATGRLRNGKVEPLGAELGFATRDAARNAPDGQLELLGRMDGTIVRGGTNVYPANVERVAGQVNGVRGSCLVARASVLYGQVPVLVIDLEGDAEAGQVKRELTEAFAEILAPTDMPVEVLVVSNLPRTALGKVQRAQVTELVNEGASP